MSKLRKRAVLQGAMVTLVLLAMACGDDAADDAADTSGTAVTSSREQTAHDEEVSNSQSFDSSAALDEDGDGYFTEREVRQAIRMTVEDYQWPELYTPSADVIVYYFSGGRSVEDLEGSLSEVGTEHTLIGGWHECAWYMT
ncbi:MAG: hypothetical protein M3439_00405 [Chloroflexota bacterium]|nr:hypothetical protein [Chloroflexota bacterium]